MSSVKSAIAPIFSILNQPDVKSSHLAEAIHKLSDFFVNFPDAQTPWEHEYCKLAYRYYYLPLNYIRNEQVVQRGLTVDFFKNIDTTIDWGAGPGTASLALAKTLKHNLKKQILIEKSTQAISTFKDLHNYLHNPTVTHELKLKNLDVNMAKTLLVFSYSLTEMQKLPDGFFDYPNIMILEPSTQEDGRKLLELRQKLLDSNYHIWAPCTHQNSCPLLSQSKTDWCHDRFHVQAPDWFWQSEKLLPFKNKTITTSYLLASKNPPPTNLKNFSRTVGDSLEEKGKTRQLVCRSQAEREFLTWMHKKIDPQTIPRGELIEIPHDIEKKSNELRVATTPVAYAQIVDSAKKTDTEKP